MNRKKKIERRIKIDDNMKLLGNKIKTEKKIENKISDKNKNLESLSVKILYANNPDNLQSVWKELNKIHLVDKKLHEIRNEIFGYYTGE